MNDALSRTEYNYIQTIQKQKDLIDALKDENKAFEKEIKKLEKEKGQLEDELAKVKKDKTDRATEKEASNDIKYKRLEERFENIKSQVLSEKEMKFYLMCKADVIMDKLYKEGNKILGRKTLEQNNFPMELLEVPTDKPEEVSGVKTTNFSLIKTGDSYKLSRINN